VSAFKSKFRQQRPLTFGHFIQLCIALALSTLLAACGGGGGGGAGEPPPVSVQAHIHVAELGGACTDTSWDCVHVGSVFIDNAAEVTMFWHERAPSSQPGWHVASHLPGDTRTRNAAYVSADLASTLQPLSLGAKRFAAVQRDTPNWTSALVDLSVPSAPYVSPRAPTPITGSRAVLISGPDGALAFGTDVPSGSFSLGGSATARGVKVAPPPGYANGWWSVFAPATGVIPTVWWAYLNSTQTDSTPELRLHLARIDASGGSAVEDRRVTMDTWRQSSIPDCSTLGGAPVLVREYGRGQVAVGWRNVNAPWTGCDVVMDGKVINDSTNHVVEGPAMAGSVAGLVAVWSETDLAGDLAPPRRIMWRRLDASTAQWTAPERLNSHRFAMLHTSATGPGGSLAIAWRGCTSPDVDTCTEYVSKHVDGRWSTEQYLPRGKGVGAPQVAINSNGQAVVVWATIYDAPCSADPVKACPSVFAYRF
jgi:hypothetical protein